MYILPGSQKRKGRDKGKLEILLVGPGIMPIPCKGWGAVENVIWQQKTYLEMLGHHVTILNKRGFLPAFLQRPWMYDVVHLHYDELARFWVRQAGLLDLPLFITTHYGYAACPEKWNGDYYDRIFEWLLKADRLILLSDEIKKTFIERGYSGNACVIPNGTETERIEFKEERGNGKAICLGKIEPRKMQARLAERIKNCGGISCDFVGPMIDQGFNADDIYVRYLGHWSRDEVYKNLTEYSCLVLASEGEAHPLVVMEAMAAGLSVVVTPEASANLDKDMPWIYISGMGDNFIENIRHACEHNHIYRGRIRMYARENFDWKVIMQRYVDTVGNVLISENRL
ncbi:glycosyltransferase family 4 protein [bacterium]|nr:glycosyltransferase family 4 protein [bacterium]